MADGIIGLPADGAGKKLDTEQLIVGANTVQRERIQLTGAIAAEIARVLNADPNGSDYALITRILQTNSAQITTVLDTAIAAGGTTTLDGAQITSGKTGKLFEVIVSSSVPLKVDLQTVLNGVATSRIVAFPESRIWDWKSPARDFITVVEDVAAGLDAFRVVIVNLDTSQPADVYTTFLYDEV